MGDNTRDALARLSPTRQHQSTTTFAASTNLLPNERARDQGVNCHVRYLYYVKRLYGAALSVCATVHAGCHVPERWGAE
jgi:hypothetical protein